MRSRSGISGDYSAVTTNTWLSYLLQFTLPASQEQRGLEECAQDTFVGWALRGVCFLCTPIPLARIQSNGYPSLQGKLWNTVNPGFQEEEEISCREYSHQTSRGESSPVGEPKDWVQSWWHITESHWTSFPSENQNQSPLLLSPQGN